MVRYISNKGIISYQREKASNILLIPSLIFLYFQLAPRQTVQMSQHFFNFLLLFYIFMEILPLFVQ